MSASGSPRPTAVESRGVSERRGSSADAAIVPPRLSSGADRCRSRAGSRSVSPLPPPPRRTCRRSRRSPVATSRGVDRTRLRVGRPARTRDLARHRRWLHRLQVFVFLTTIAALWGLLAATRLLRGEEDTGTLAARARRQHPSRACDRGDARRSRGGDRCRRSPRSRSSRGSPAATPTSGSGWATAWCYAGIASRCRRPCSPRWVRSRRNSAKTRRSPPAWGWWCSR